MTKAAWPLCWMVALPAEARMLLDSYGFSRLTDKPFPLYHSDKHSMHLVISGMGKINSAAATAWLGAQLSPQRIWINLGIAGHKKAPIGSGYWVDKIVDDATANCYYPTILFPWRTTAVRCYDKAQTDYPAASLVDMESSGFFPTASLFTHQELVHLYKLVTDNTSQPPTRTKEILQSHQWSELQKGVSELRRLAAEELGEARKMNQELAEWERILATRFHFTATRLIQLRQLLRKWRLLNSRSPLELPAKDAAELLRALSE